MNLKYKHMKKMKLYIAINIAMAAFGLALCITTAMMFSKGFPFELMMMCGLLGTMLTGMGISLTVDMFEIQSQFKKLGTNI
jgi:uncharacterized membrane protein